MSGFSLRAGMGLAMPDGDSGPVIEISKLDFEETALAGAALAVVSIYEARAMVSLSSLNFDDLAAAGDTLAALEVGMPWTFKLLDNAGGRVALLGNNIVRGLTSLDHMTMPKISFTVEATDGKRMRRKTFVANVRATPKLAVLRTASIAAKNNNPIELPDHPSPPTLEYKTATSAALAPVFGVSENPLVYRTSGKIWKQSGGTRRTWAAHLSLRPRTDGSIKIGTNGWTVTPAVPPEGYDTGAHWNVRLKATGLQIFEIELPSVSASAPMRVIVDGQFINRDGHGFGLGNRWLTLTWPVAGTHEIEIEVGFGQPISGVRLNTGAALVEPTRKPKAVVVGTSFEEGLLIGKYTAGTWVKNAAGVDRFAPWDSHFATFCKLNGYDFRCSALGGSGYTATAGAQKILGQMDYWISDDVYDLVVFGGPYNDKDIGLPTMRTNARLAWEKARLNQPNAVILVHGCCGGATVTADASSTILAETALKAEFDAWVSAGENRAFFIPVSPSYAAAWIKNTNYQDWISTDNTHPYRGDATHGHIGLGYKFSAAWRSLIGV